MVIPSGATHVGPKTGYHFKLVSLTPFKVMRWASVKWVNSAYSTLGYKKFKNQTRKLKPKFRGNT